MTQPLVANFPAITIQIAFDTNPGIAAPVYELVGEFLRGRLSTRRGKSFELDAVQAGTASFRLDDSDRRFDPMYAGVLTNRLPNPSFETNVTGWNTVMSTFVQTATRFVYGSKSGRCTVLGTPVNYSVDALFSTTGVHEAGNTKLGSYRFVAQIWADAAIVGKTLTMIIREEGGSAATSDHTSGTVLVAGWNVCSVTSPLDQHDRTGVRCVIQRGPAPGDGEWFDVDGASLEYSASGTFGTFLYTDGDLDNCRWAGTAHNSASYRGGPYYPNVVPGREIYINAIWNDGGDPPYTHRLFTGFVERWPAPERSGPKRRYVTVECVDAFAQMAETKINGTYGIALSNAHITAYLDSASWPAALRSIGVGSATVMARTLDEATLLSELQAVANETELGNVFISADGLLTFQGRNYRLQNFGVPEATYSDKATPASLLYPYITAPFSSESLNLKNLVRATRPGGLEQEVSDATSIARYGPVPRVLTKAPLLNTNSDTLDYANYLLDRYKDPDLRVPVIELHPRMHPASWQKALSIDLGMRVRVEGNPPPAGSAAQGIEVHVDGISHDIDKTDWVTKFMTTACDPNLYWQLDSATLSVLGSTTRLAF